MNEAEFLRAILADPDDDVVRLAFADWLQESGSPARMARGEFIQVQVRLARRTRQGVSAGEWIDADRVPGLMRREKELLGAHGADWAAFVAPHVTKHEFRRGFVEQIAIDGNAFLQHGEDLLAHAPIRRVRFTAMVAARVLASPLLARLPELDLSRLGGGNALMSAVLASESLDSLRWLDLGHNHVNDRAMALLAASPLLGRLTHLDLSHNRITLEGVQALHRSPHWGSLRSLVLAGNPIDSRAQQFLTQSLLGAPEAGLLRVMLQMASREEREYTCAEVRGLAAEAGKTPALAAVVLAGGLGDGQRRVRSAAAQMLSRIGEGAAALPALVQRLFDREKLVRDAVAPALAQVLEGLPPAMQQWMCFLANPLLPPEGNLKNALERPDLPEAAAAAFCDVCARRGAWHAHTAAGKEGPAPAPDPASYPRSKEAARQAWKPVAKAAAKHAARHHAGAEADRKREGGAHRESAWLLGRLAGLIQDHSARASGSATART